MTASAEHIQDWLVTYLSTLLQVRPEEIDVTLSFEQFGLDSTTVVGMTGDLSTAVGIDLDPTLAYDFPTIEKFANAISTRAPEYFGVRAEQAT
jgi:acyl carrier protein